MRHTFLLTLLTLACASDPAGDGPAPRADDGIPAAAPSIAGTITAADPLSIRVEVDPTAESGSDKAQVRLRPATRVLHPSGAPAPRSLLVRGRAVRVWFVGPVAESYPVQATGGTIVIDGE
jgi:hypothetical protein